MNVKQGDDVTRRRADPRVAQVPREARQRDLSQQRSRDRLETILATAARLIAAKGSDAVKMSEIAAEAEISIGSLYQYFPDKPAILLALAEAVNAASRECIVRGLAGVSSVETFLAAFSALVDEFYAMALKDPVLRDIWSGTQADPRLRDLQLAESRACADLLATVMAPLSPGTERATRDAALFLIWELGEAAVRLAVSVPRREGDRLVAIYKRMALRELTELAAERPPRGR